VLKIYRLQKIAPATKEETLSLIKRKVGKPIRLEQMSILFYALQSLFDE